MDRTRQNRQGRGRPENTIDHSGLNDISTALRCDITLIFSREHGTFSRRNHVPGHKQVLIHVKGLQSYQVWSLTKVKLNEKSTTEGNLENPQMSGKQTPPRWWERKNHTATLKKNLVIS